MYVPKSELADIVLPNVSVASLLGVVPANGAINNVVVFC